MPYHPALVQPMRDELTQLGVRELRTVAEVDAVLGEPEGTILLFINSVCGCAAGNARPALARALQHPTLPTHVVTVFAGQDVEAVARARSYFSEYEPSSPSIVMLQEGDVLFFVHRHQIEGRSPDAIAADLTAAFDKYCAVPSV